MAIDGQEYYRIQDLAGKRWPNASEEDVLQWCIAGHFSFFVYVHRTDYIPSFETIRHNLKNPENKRGIPACFYGSINNRFIVNMVDSGLRSITVGVFNIKSEGDLHCSSGNETKYIVDPKEFPINKFLVASSDVERFENKFQHLTTGAEVMEESSPADVQPPAAKTNERTASPAPRPAVQYPPKLAAAIAAFEAVNGSDLKGKSPMDAMEKWLKDNAKDHPCIVHKADKDKYNRDAIKQITKVANWKPKGGAPKIS